MRLLNQTKPAEQAKYGWKKIPRTIKIKNGVEKIGQVVSNFSGNQPRIEYESCPTLYRKSVKQSSLTILLCSLIREAYAARGSVVWNEAVEVKKKLLNWRWYNIGSDFPKILWQIHLYIPPFPMYEWKMIYFLNETLKSLYKERSAQRCYFIYLAYWEWNWTITNGCRDQTEVE